MKCMRKGPQMVRVSNDEAQDMAKDGWQYASKSEYRLWLERQEAKETS